MSNINIGARAQNLHIGAEVPNITRINLVVDSNHMHTAGNDTGRTMEVECPWGTQAMADRILATVSGVRYKPYTAERAMLDLAFELGDAVTVGGVYSQIISADINYNGAGLATIGAPDLDEIDDEYPAEQTQSNSSKRQRAYTRALITKTANEITAGIYGENGLVTEFNLALGTIEGRIEGVEGEATYIRADLDGITNRVQDAEGNIAALELTAKQLVSEISGKVGSDYVKTLIDQSLGSVKISVSSKDGETSLKLKQGNVTIDTETIDLTVKAANVKGTLTAGKLKGGSIDLLSSTGTEVGGLSLTSASSADYAVALSSKGALKLAATGNGKPSVYLEALGKYGLGVQYVSSLKEYYVTAVKCGIMSASDGKYDCGSEDFPWLDVYSVNEPTVTSDANLKHDGEDLPEKYVAMFDLLQPKRAKYNAGTSGRFHPCYFAQDVKAAMDAAGIDSTEFGGWVLHRSNDGTERQMLRYGELDPIRDAKIKQIDRRLKRLEELYEIQ